MPFQVSCLPLGIEEFSNNPFEVYPNPVNNILFINNIQGYNIQKIKIVDSNGRILLEKKGDVSEINMQNFQNEYIY